MVYPIYKSSNLTTPFLTISDNTIDSTSTSISFIGRRKVDFGNAQQQNALWQLENFANSTAPGAPITGQIWYDSALDVLKVYDGTIGGGAGGWVKVYSIKTGNTLLPSPEEGEFFYLTTTNKLNLYTNSTWIEMGPADLLPVSQFQFYNVIGTTTNGVQTELFIDGVLNSRLIVPLNTTWLYEITGIAKSGSSYGGWKLEGAIDNSSNTVSIAIPPAITVLSTSTWDITVDADNVNKSLRFLVTGAGSTTIKWNIVVKITKIAS